MDVNVAVNNKFVATKNVGLINEGTIITVTNVDEDEIVSFTFGEHSNANGYMDSTTFKKHFKKLQLKEKETVNNTKITEISYEYVDEIMQNSEIEIQTVFNNCVVVSCKLPNGFVIVESEYCPNVTEYNEESYADICLDKIAEKIFELETYRLQEEIYRETYGECFNCDCDDCDNCECDEAEDNADDFIEPDCKTCSDYQCEYHPFNIHNLETKHPIN